MTSASSTNSKAPSHRRSTAGQSNGSPVLSVASVVAGALGLICGYSISWIASIVLGIVAAIIGILAHRKQSALLWLAKIGVVLGVACILASFVLVAVVSFQMIRLGLA